MEPRTHSIGNEPDRSVSWRDRRGRVWTYYEGFWDYGWQVGNLKTTWHKARQSYRDDFPLTEITS